jgi:hypothetical protein
MLLTPAYQKDEHQADFSQASKETQIKNYNSGCFDRLTVKGIKLKNKFYFPEQDQVEVKNICSPNVMYSIKQFCGSADPWIRILVKLCRHKKLNFYMKNINVTVSNRLIKCVGTKHGNRV